MWSRTSSATRLGTAQRSHIKRHSSHPHRTHVLRALSTTEPSPCPDHDIYVSTSTDPYFNLTFEDWLFHHSPPNKPLLLVYRDSPCVVIGRNQNPWTEVNFSALHDARIPFLRRRSGGGTVYHDLGNTNFSIHLPRTSFDRHSTGHLVLTGVRALGIDANLNNRNDICVGTDKMSLDLLLNNVLSPKLLYGKNASGIRFYCSISLWPYSTSSSVSLNPFLSVHLLTSDQYVSGSAYKIVNNRAYHHGTMLISTELSTLGAVLRPQKAGIVTKGVESVRSPVCNLRQFDQNVSHESFTSAVVEQFRREYGVTTEPVIVYDTKETKGIDYIKQGMAELSTWDWMYGQTPEFTQTLQTAFKWGTVSVELHSRRGIISDCGVCIQSAHASPDPGLPALPGVLKSLLEGKKYGFLSDVSSEVALSQPVQDLYSWLRHTTDI